MAKYCDIFWSFFKVGTFTIGGGYAMIPLMQREIVDRHRWLTEEEFMDEIALSQAMPGVFAVNMAAMTGQRLRGAAGSAVAIVGNILMPILFILLLAMFFRSFRDNVYVERIFLGLRPAVVALIAAPVFTIFKNEKGKWKKEKEADAVSLCWANTPLSSFLFSLSIYIIPILSALLIWLLGVSPILIVLAAALLGLLYSKLKDKN